MPAQKVPVKVQKRSAFNKSHVHQLSSNVGTITPILIDEVVPNSTVRLRINLGASMPPLASDAYMKCDVAVEAFFIPLRLCYGGFEAWFCQREDNYIDAQNDDFESLPAYMPVARVNLGDGATDRIRDLFGVRGLPDFLGYSGSYQSFFEIDINPLPFVAYHLVWQHFYRNPLVEKECFARPKSGGLNPFVFGPHFSSILPFVTILESGNRFIYDADNDDTVWELADGHTIFSLRQRNFDFDYFTNCFPTPTLGEETKVVPAQDGSFTIAQLRLANAMADFQNTNQIAGTRYNDTLKARYGASLHDGVAQRPVCLGSARYNVYNKSLTVQGMNNYSATGQLVPQYPEYAEKAGAVLGNAYASGSDLIIDNFTANEPGYILVNATLVPQVTYGSSLDRLLTRYRSVGSLADMAQARFQGVGNQPVFQYELTGRISSSELMDSRVFGYTDRFADWMTKHDRVSGLLRSGRSLGFMVAQRNFGQNESPTITSSWLKIPRNYLDNIFVFEDNSSHYGYWLEAAFDYTVVMPLAQYSIPSLVDPAQEHGDTFMIHRGGFRF